MDQTLILTAEEIRGKTVKLLDGLSDADARFAAPGLHNPILWHAGHAVMLLEHLGVLPLTGSTQTGYPAGWFEMFSWKSDPRQVPADAWPSVVEVRAELTGQLDRFLKLMVAADEATLSKRDAKGRPTRWLIIHGLHDEAIHQGEMFLLRKLLAKR